MKTYPTASFFAGALTGAVLAALVAGSMPSRATADCIAPPSGLIAWWALDETSGDIAVNRAGLPHGVYYGNAAHGEGVVAGGVHLPSNGTGFLAVADHPQLDLGTGDFTIDAWIWSNGSFDAKSRTIIDKRNGSVGYWFYRNEVGQLAFQMGDTQGFTTYTAPDTYLYMDWWNFVAVTVDRVNHLGRLYVNGQLVFSFTPRNGSLSNAHELRIGMSFDTDLIPFHGRIDEVEVFNRALGVGEVGALYAAGASGMCKTVGVDDAAAPARSVVFGLANNPLRTGRTDVRFALAREERVTIRVCDLAGRLVRRIDTDLLAPGEHRIALDAMRADGQPLERGIYFVKVSLSTSGVDATRRWVVVR